MSLLKKILRHLQPNPFDTLLKNAVKKNHKSFLIVWNRGLGDIALGLYALIYRIHSFIPNAEITFLTRQDLHEGFLLLPNIKIKICHSLKRNFSFSLSKIADECALTLSEFDVILEKPDPTYWLSWQLGKLQPRLTWQSVWDNTSIKLPENKKFVAVHVNSETSYGYDKNWQSAYWNTLFDDFQKKGIHCLLFGNTPSETWPQANLIDLRGKTSLLEALSLIKNHCSHFIGPDSGLLSILYYLDEAFEIRLISLWADPMQGILKQNVPSPNPLLEHTPLIAKERNLLNLEPTMVMQCLMCTT